MFLQMIATIFLVVSVAWMVKYSDDNPQILVLIWGMVIGALFCL